MIKFKNILYKSIYFSIRAISATIVIFTPTVAYADGGSGPLIPNQIVVQGGIVYIMSTNFNNPDNCASAAVIALAPANSDELDRMLSLVTTALASGKSLLFWTSGCGSSPWYASVPLAGAVTLVR